MRARTTRAARRSRTLACMSVTAVLWTAGTAYAGSARDYLNAPVDSWLLNYNAGYTTSLTPEDGTDHGSRRSRQRARPIGRAHPNHGLLGPHRRLLARFAVCAHRHQRRPVPRQHERRFRCRLPLADEHFRRTGADARAVPVLRAPDVLELSSPGDDADWILPAELSDQSERESLDDLANRQFQLHARSRLDLARNLCRPGAFSPTTAITS